MNLSPTRTSKTRGKNCQRQGTQVVELALILPVLFLFLFSTLEICEQTFLLQRVKIAAQEGAVVAITRQATLADVEGAVQNYLEARGVDFGGDISAAVVVTPDPTEADTLTPVNVTVSVSNDANSQIGSFFYRYIGGTNSVASVTMFKEFQRN